MEQQLMKKEMSKKIESKFVFVMFYVLGSLSYIPQTFYITANDYWMYKFQNPDNATDNSSNPDSKTELQTKFSSYYSIVSNTCVAVGLVLTILAIKRCSIQKRLVVPLSTVLGLLVVTMIFVWVDTDTWQTGFFGVSLTIGGLINGFAICFMVTVVQAASKFPPVYLGAVLSGQSICGILSAVVQILTLSMGTTSKVSAFIYFILGSVVIATVQALYLLVLAKHEYYQDRMNSGEEEAPPEFTREKVKRILKKIAPSLVTMGLTTGSMVAMHPGVTSLVESASKGAGRWGDSYFVPVCTFLTFSVFDFIGRECAFRLNLITNKYVMLAASVLRLGLIPLLLFCNVQPRNHLPVLFPEDYVYFLFVLSFAVTNGYMSNLCFVKLPSICDEEEMKIALLFILVVLIVSLGACAALSSVLIKAV